MGIAAFVLRDLVGLTLIGAGAAKVATVGDFAATVGTFIRSSERIAVAVALILSLVEIGVGLAVFSAAAIRPVDFAACALTGTFVIVSGYGARVAPGTRCRCFGSIGSTRFDRWAVLRALALLAISCTAAVLDVERGAAPAHSGLGLGLALAASFMFAVAAGQAALALRTLTSR